jgi:3-oxoacyl-[acyl-carrier protein] reductase
MLNCPGISGIITGINTSIFFQKFTWEELEMEFKDTVAVVTGAARGIGKEIARQLYIQGGNVILVDLDSNQLGLTVSELDQQKGNRIVQKPCDIADPAAVENIFRDIKEDFGQLDILVNNAGITRDNLFLRMKVEEWMQVITVNLTGAFLCARYGSVLIRKSARGRIINISSIAAKGNPGQANYSASKAGLIGLTRTLALELARYGITVNAVAPGFIDTEMTKAIPEKAKEEWMAKIPCARAGQVKDVATAVLFLASQGASYITGQLLGVDGGLSI